MPTATDILNELQTLAEPHIKRILLKHDIPEPLLGVKVEHLKKIQKRIKKDYQLSLDLYDTGIYDAMYLAGLIADDKKMSRKDLKHWADSARSRALCGSVVAAVAAESNHGWDLALEWIDSKKEIVAATGWSTLGFLVSIKPDEQLDFSSLKKLIARVQNTIHQSPNAVRAAMNIFLVSVSIYVLPLSEFALETATRIGKVEVDVGDTDCKIPYAPDYIQKAKKRGNLGKKRKTARC